MQYYVAKLIRGDHINALFVIVGFIFGWSLISKPIDDKVSVVLMTDMIKLMTEYI
jgi:hypothetical protein